MSFIGKTYRLERQENFDKFVNAFGDISAEQKQAQINHVPTLKVDKNGDAYRLVTTRPPGDTPNEINFKSGVEFDDTVSGHPVKTTVTIDGDTLTQVQKGSNGVTFTIKREFTADSCVATMTSSVFEGAAKRWYKAI